MLFRMRLTGCALSSSGSIVNAVIYTRLRWQCVSRRKLDRGDPDTPQKRRWFFPSTFSHGLSTEKTDCRGASARHGGIRGVGGASGAGLRRLIEDCRPTDQVQAAALEESGGGHEIWPTSDCPNVRKRGGCSPVHQGPPHTVHLRTRQRIWLR